MALQLDKELESGVVGNYWKILAVSFDVLARNSFITLALYKDQAARQAGKQYLKLVTYTWNGDDYPFESAAMDAESPLVLAYAKLKNLPDFQGALDV